MKFGLIKKRVKANTINAHTKGQSLDQITEEGNKLMDATSISHFQSSTTSLKGVYDFLKTQETFFQFYISSLLFCYEKVKKNVKKMM